MSLLNAKLNQFTIWFPKNFLYPEVVKRWTPVVKRLKLQYDSLEDFLNASIQSVTFPEIALPLMRQQESQYPIDWRGGKELEPLLTKTVTVTFKMIEGFITYWMIFDQIEEYLRYQESNPWWPPMYVSFLDHHGFELVVFEFEKITPIGMSAFDVGYSSVAAEFSPFRLSMHYNRFKMIRRLDDENYTAGKSES
jgi:hypothetical protein